MADLFSGASAQSTPSVFNFDTNTVRVVMREGEPWFVASDICAALGYKNASKAVADHLDSDERYNESLERGGTLVLISESGMYTLVLRSHKTEARRFAKWVTSEVLPTIRKTGRYEAPGKEMTVNEMVDKMTRLLGTGNSYPPILFMPLVNAVMRKQGYTFFLPHQQAQEVTERLDRLSMLFHPLSSPASDVFAIGRVLRGLDAKSSAEEPSYRQVLPPVAGTAFFRQVEPGVLVRA